MSKVIAFLYAFIITLTSCYASVATVTSYSDVIPIKTKSSFTAIDAVIVEVVVPPRHVLVETNKILQYQLRHRYTLDCLGDKYGAIDYKINGTKVESILLLSNQTIEVNSLCSVKKGDPVGSIYIYKRI